MVLASQICDVPVSLISLVDDDRQWFKARNGFEPRQTPLDQSVCSHAILQNEYLEIEDMSSDARTSDNPLHTGGPKVQFYAGANLIAPNGMPIGTLCVLDNKPRQLTDFQRQALKTLSRQVMTQLELRKRIAEEEALKSEMDHRVRNSLQTIGAVMRAASRQVKEPSAVDVLSIVERRIDAVAELHSELMVGNGEGAVKINQYLERVVGLLEEVSPDNVRLSVEARDTVFASRRSSAIGMIVSEFTANSIKHAFPDGRRGNVKIALSGSRENKWILRCTDDGIGRQGRPEGTGDITRNTGLGQMLMASAATQLSGELEYESGKNGTSLTVHFKT